MQTLMPQHPLTPRPRPPRPTPNTRQPAHPNTFPITASRDRTFDNESSFATANNTRTTSERDTPNSTANSSIHPTAPSDNRKFTDRLPATTHPHNTATHCPHSVTHFHSRTPTYHFYMCGWVWAHARSKGCAWGRAWRACPLWDTYMSCACDLHVYLLVPSIPVGFPQMYNVDTSCVLVGNGGMWVGLVCACVRVEQGGCVGSAQVEGRGFLPLLCGALWCGLWPAPGV